ncbi:hypothetical protein [Dehalobacter restrictus]|nr:hypothetical protein [Dehalobacter restrictus]
MLAKSCMLCGRNLYAFIGVNRYALYYHSHYPTSIYLTDDTTGKVIARADANADWSRDEITYAGNEQMINPIVSGFIMEILFHNRLLFKHGWSGSKTLYFNGSAPLQAIVLLEQAPENQITRIPVAQAAAKITPRCFLPYYDQSIMAMCLHTLSEVLSGVGVYSLKCRPDREAVEMLQHCLVH